MWHAAEAAVIARVQAKTSGKTDAGSIYTRLTFEVLEELLPVPVPQPLMIEMPGGEADGWVEVVSNVPTFAKGQLYILLLAQVEGRGWQPLQLDLGVFSLAPSSGTRLFVGQPLVINGSGGVADGGTWTWDDFWHRTSDARPAVRVPNLRREWLVLSEAAQFQFGRPAARLFECDQGNTVPFAIDPRGDGVLGPDASLAAVVQGLEAWNTVDGSSLRLVDGGYAESLETACPDPTGQSFKVRFQDPDNMIPPPIDCRGILALTSYRANLSETKLLGGQEFARIRCAVVSFADEWEQCPNWNSCNLAEIATHELGHAIGLGHSSERVPEPNSRLRDATMYVQAHFDGRCAGLREDDKDAVRFLYPALAPLSVLGDVTLVPALAGAPYAHRFEVVAATPPVAWRLGRSDYCGLELDQTGLLRGPVDGCLCWSRSIGPAPTPAPTPYLFVTAEDATCRAHTRFFTIPIELPEGGNAPLPSCTPTSAPPLQLSPTPTLPMPCTSSLAPSPTASPTGTPTKPPDLLFTPTATQSIGPSPAVQATLSATPSLTPSPRPTASATVSSRCTGDCDRSGVVTVDEVVRMVNIALGTLPPMYCLAGDRDGNGQITVDEIVEAVNWLLVGC